jgi:hypothetical protein
MKIIWIHSFKLTYYISFKCFFHLLSFRFIFKHSHDFI